MENYPIHRSNMPKDTDTNSPKRPDASSIGHILLRKALALIPRHYPIFWVYDGILSRAGYLIAARSPSTSVLPRMHACINGNPTDCWFSLFSSTKNDRDGGRNALASANFAPRRKKRHLKLHFQAQQVCPAPPLIREGGDDNDFIEIFRLAISVARC